MAPLGLALGLACESETSRSEFPGMRLKARLESHLQREQATLKGSLVHYGLVFPVHQDDLLAYLRPIRFHGAGLDIALGTEDAVEPHGGGLLRLLVDHWRPQSRPARLTDRFWFETNGSSLALGAIYQAHRDQVFLPIPGLAPEEVGGRLPGSPQLPRMCLPFPPRGGEGRCVESDSYKLLGLLVELEPDPSLPWTNRLGQTLTVELLLRHAREHYLATRDTPFEPPDHSNLHLVELLLSFERGREGRGAEAVKERFLNVELSRTDFDPTDEALLLGHYVESLGQLIAHPRVAWREDEARRVKAWLTELEERRFRELDAIELESLAHLLRGLRSIEAHQHALE
jgi:hypothetical protein